MLKEKMARRGKNASTLQHSFSPRLLRSMHGRNRLLKVGSDAPEMAFVMDYDPKKGVEPTVLDLTFLYSIFKKIVHEQRTDRC